MLTVSIDPETERNLEALGAASTSSKTDLAQRLLREAVREDMEDQAWVRLAEERLARTSKRYSMAEVLQDLDLDD